VANPLRTSTAGRVLPGGSRLSNPSQLVRLREQVEALQKENARLHRLLRLVEADPERHDVIDLTTAEAATGVGEIARTMVELDEIVITLVDAVAGVGTETATIRQHIASLYEVVRLLNSGNEGTAARGAVDDILRANYPSESAR
jgi:hypothetical protein